MSLDDSSTANLDIRYKKLARDGKLNKRTSVLNETKLLFTLYNWWKNHDLNDGKFINIPVKPKHKNKVYATLRIKRENEQKTKQMSRIELHNFMHAFPKDSLMQDFAWIQFFSGGRVSEPAAIAVEDIDLDKGTIRLQRHISYAGDKREAASFGWLKTGTARNVVLPKYLIPILQRRIQNSAWVQLDGERRKLLFHKNGKELSYRSIQHAYSQAMKKAGLAGKFTATHVLRYTMAGIACELAGAKASMTITGHESEKVAKVYHLDRGKDKLQLSTSKKIEADMLPYFQGEVVQSSTSSF